MDIEPKISKRSTRSRKGTIDSSSDVSQISDKNLSRTKSNRNEGTGIMSNFVSKIELGSKLNKKDNTKMHSDNDYSVDGDGDNRMTDEHTYSSLLSFFNHYGPFQLVANCVRSKKLTLHLKLLKICVQMFRAHQVVAKISTRWPSTIGPPWDTVHNATLVCAIVKNGWFDRYSQYVIILNDLISRWQASVRAPIQLLFETQT